jgi:hypothetical protein
MKLPLVSLTLGLLATPAFAVVNIDWVDVGHINNPADTTLRVMRCFM